MMLRSVFVTQERVTPMFILCQTILYHKMTSILYSRGKTMISSVFVPSNSNLKSWKMKFTMKNLDLWFELNRLYLPPPALQMKHCHGELRHHIWVDGSHSEIGKLIFSWRVQFPRSYHCQIILNPGSWMPFCSLFLDSVQLFMKIAYENFLQSKLADITNEVIYNRLFSDVSQIQYGKQELISSNSET